MGTFKLFFQRPSASRTSKSFLFLNFWKNSFKNMIRNLKKMSDRMYDLIFSSKGMLMNIFNRTITAINVDISMFLKDCQFKLKIYNFFKYYLSEFWNVEYFWRAIGVTNDTKKLKIFSKGWSGIFEKKSKRILRNV